MKILHYLNQFFGQQGGEEKTSMPPMYIDKPVGPGMLFNTLLNEGKIVGTVLCGDNYYAENMEKAREEILELVRKMSPDLLITGPAFNAGRYGMACADLAQAVKKEFGIPVVTGLYEENPAIEIYKRELPIVKTGNSAASMREAAVKMAAVSDKLLRGEELGIPEEEGLIPMGKRVNVFKKEKAAVRAVSMLISKIKGEAYESEIPIPVYDMITPASPIKDLSSATIALLTSGGIVPKGNPDHLPAATAKFYKKYDIKDLSLLEGGKFESVHAGYDPVYANENPNRVAPLDLLRIKERKGEIKSLYPYLVTTTGNSTSVADATRMGEEIAKELLSAGVDGAIMTST
jgi:betaine reductase